SFSSTCPSSKIHPWLRYTRRRSCGKYRDVTPCISRSLKRRYQLRTSRDPSPGDYINIPCPVARQALSCSEVTCDFTTKLQAYSRKIAALQNSLRIYRWHKVMDILENAKIRRILLSLQLYQHIFLPMLYSILFYKISHKNKRVIINFFN
ncbi:hypothetical protein ALC56_03325, partial [Trachymyrmex septentrionalis]